MNLPSQDSATGRALKTAMQAIIGFFIGLILAVWAVPGVPEAIIAYIKSNFVGVALMIGVPSGLTSFIMNLFRPDVKNY